MVDDRDFYFPKAGAQGLLPLLVGIPFFIWGGIYLYYGAGFEDMLEPGIPAVLCVLLAYGVSERHRTAALSIKDGEATIRRNFLRNEERYYYSFPLENITRVTELEGGLILHLEVADLPLGD